MNDKLDPTEIAGHAVDDRHHLLDLRVTENALVGDVEVRYGAAVGRWAKTHGVVDAAARVGPRPGIATRQTLLKTNPGAHATNATEVVLGQPLEVLRSRDAWVEVRTVEDSYIGWTRADAVVAAAYPASHAVSALRSHAYRTPRVQGEVVAELSWGARLRVLATHGDWHEVRLPDGTGAFVSTAVATPIDRVGRVATLDAWERFLGTPYVWGGATGWGIDCSGFIQLLHRMAGIAVPRDTDEQATFGRTVTEPDPGDVATFPGHIGLYLGEGRMVHASGSAMCVTVDVIEETPHLRESLRGFVRF